MGQKMGQTGAGYGGRSRHAAWSAEMSGGVWWVTGVGEVQVDDKGGFERIWGAGVTNIEAYYEEL